MAAIMLEWVVVGCSYLILDGETHSLKLPIEHEEGLNYIHYAAIRLECVV